MNEWCEMTRCMLLYRCLGTLYRHIDPVETSLYVEVFYRYLGFGGSITLFALRKPYSEYRVGVAWSAYKRHKKHKPPPRFMLRLPKYIPGVQVLSTDLEHPPWAVLELGGILSYQIHLSD